MQEFFLDIRNLGLSVRYGMGEHTDKPQFPILLKPMVDFSPPPLDFPRVLCYNIPNENPL